jgi:hypothetical protein
MKEELKKSHGLTLRLGGLKCKHFRCPLARWAQFDSQACEKLVAQSRPYRLRLAWTSYRTRPDGGTCTISTISSHCTWRSAAFHNLHLSIWNLISSVLNVVTMFLTNIHSVHLRSTTLAHSAFKRTYVCNKSLSPKICGAVHWHTYSFSYFHIAGELITCQLPPNSTRFASVNPYQNY